MYISICCTTYLKAMVIHLYFNTCSVSLFSPIRELLNFSVPLAYEALAADHCSCHAHTHARTHTHLLTLRIYVYSNLLSLFPICLCVKTISNKIYYKNFKIS